MTGSTGSMIDVPSASLPGTPRFRCLLPTGWTATPAPAALVAMRPPDAGDRSVLVSATRVAPDVDLREMAVRSFARQRARHPDLRLDSQRVGRFGERITYVRAVTIPAEPELAQIHALFFAPRRAASEVADVITVVGSCPTSSVETFGPTVVDVVASFDFGE